MVMGRPRKAGATRPERRVKMKELEPVDGKQIPAMPDPQQWVHADDWAEPVKAWWQSAHSSPMSSEFTESDIHGLYLACMYLHESLNPRYKVAERLKLATAWESTIKNYGLSPHSRQNLKWTISQGEQAAIRTEELRANNRTKKQPQPKTTAAATGVDAAIIQLYRDHS